MLLIHSRDVELNARPKKLSFLFFFHWNINGNETLDILDSSTEANDPKINISSDSLSKFDCSSNTKRVGVCMLF